jgi:transposase InsO family protein
MDGGFGLEALEPALMVARPELCNSAQGAQLTSVALTGRRTTAGIQRSMDGRGRALENVFVERLWRTVKYEEVVRHEVACVAAVTAWAGYRPMFYHRYPIRACVTGNGEVRSL